MKRAILVVGLLTVDSASVRPLFPSAELRCKGNQLVSEKALVLVSANLKLLAKLNIKTRRLKNKCMTGGLNPVASLETNGTNLSAKMNFGYSGIH